MPANLPLPDGRCVRPDAPRRGFAPRPQLAEPARHRVLRRCVCARRLAPVRWAGDGSGVSARFRWSDILNDRPFTVIAERELNLRGPADRVVRLAIGVPEPDPLPRGDFRCPFQVIGLSDDSVHYAHGVDSFQALNLAFAGIR